MQNRLDGGVCTPEQRGGDAAAYIPDPDADLRWRNWQARGAASDRRIATRTRMVMLVIAAAWAVWFFVQLG